MNMIGYIGTLQQDFAILFSRKKDDVCLSFGCGFFKCLYDDRTIYHCLSVYRLFRSSRQRSRKSISLVYPYLREGRKEEEARSAATQLFPNCNNDHNILFYIACSSHSSALPLSSFFFLEILVQWQIKLRSATW